VIWEAFMFLLAVVLCAECVWALYVIVKVAGLL